MNTLPEKPQLRETSLQKRAAIAPGDARAWSSACCTLLYETISAIAPAGAIIAGYASIKNEIDVMPALLKFAKAHYPVVLPVMGKEEGKRQLLFHAWKPGDTLTPKTYGIHEPDGGSAPVIPDIIIVPLLAFDRRGHRLGYGGGYYDAVLRKLRAAKPEALAIGAAFNFQEVSSLPDEAYDEPLGKIVTHTEVISIR